MESWQRSVYTRNADICSAPLKYNGVLVSVAYIFSSKSNAVVHLYSEAGISKFRVRDVHWNAPWNRISNLKSRDLLTNPDLNNFKNPKYRPLSGQYTKAGVLYCLLNFCRILCHLSRRTCSTIQVLSVLIWYDTVFWCGKYRVMLING